MKEFLYYFKQNRGAVGGAALIILFALVAFLAPLIAPHNPTEVFSELNLVPPFWHSTAVKGHLLGTDDIGRDLFSRLVYGARVSLGVGALVVVFSTVFGAAIGLFAGYVGGWVDKIIMRLMDILMALPSILLAVVVVSVLGPSLFNAIVAVSIVSLPNFVRIVRAQVLQEKQKTYVMALRSFGASPMRIALGNIFPNCLAPLIVQATLGFSDGILNAAALGFLGLGAQPPTPEWGTMLADSRQFIESAPYLVTLPGVCILVVVLSFNLFGDGLRDALDPRLKR